MKTRLLLIAHAPLAQALHLCAQHVFPDCAAELLTLDVEPHESPEQTLAAARALLAPAGGAPVLVLTDIVGATPCNVARRLVDGVHSRLVSGVNLPMLLRVLSYRGEPLQVLLERALVGGTQGVTEVLAERASHKFEPHASS